MTERDRYYILDASNRPIKADLMAWAQWFETIGNHVVGFAQITSQVHVSTVFLGIDHNWSGNGPPILFETMVFGGERDGEQYRFAHYDDAKDFHDGLVEGLRQLQRKKREQV